MSILVVAAHPDDEVLGAGGTIARHTAAGDTVHVLLMTGGRDSEALTKAAQTAGKYLGVESVEVLDLPDNRLDSLDSLDIVQMVEKRVNKLKPEIVYTHHGADLNIDHRLTYQAVMAACRPLPKSSVHTILCFEVPSSTEWGDAFAPNYFVEIDLNKKIEALKAYQTEMRVYPHPRSYQAVEYLARWRGATVGLETVEALVAVRQVVKGRQNRNFKI